jgi:phospholipase/carboxylesterase
MEKANIHTAGKQLEHAKRALIMIHGRGGSADDIISLSHELNVTDFAILAPQAENNTWYPYSFLSPPKQNEPWLSISLQSIGALVTQIEKEGISKDGIYFLGFSQGACLMLEFIARNASKYGGAVAFTGGLIGDNIHKENYKGSFGGSPIFIGTSDPDMHVPVSRVHETTGILKDMGAVVTEKVYKNMGHTIIPDEIHFANTLVFNH